MMEGIGGLVITNQSFANDIDVLADKKKEQEGHLGPESLT